MTREQQRLRARDALATAMLVISEANGQPVDPAVALDQADRVVLHGTREELELVLDTLVGSLRKGTQ